LVAVLAAIALLSVPRLRAAADTLPAKLSDQEFWKLINDLSEDNGYFRSDNLLSNEIGFETIIPDLLSRTRPAGSICVGPEQMHLTALKPKIVFITDIRRGNMHTQLMRKALFDGGTALTSLFTKSGRRG
jgi:hypothetical protein